MKSETKIGNINSLSMNVFENYHQSKKEEKADIIHLNSAKFIPVRIMILQDMYILLAEVQFW